MELGNDILSKAREDRSAQLAGTQSKGLGKISVPAVGEPVRQSIIGSCAITQHLLNEKRVVQIILQAKGTQCHRQQSTIRNKFLGRCDTANVLGKVFGVTLQR